MRTLITGGAGFIASHIVDTYLAEGFEVAVFDNLSSGKRTNLPPSVQIYEGDICNVEQLASALSDFEPDIVNHHAAQVSVIVSTQDPRQDATRNVLGTVSVLDACTKAGVTQFIYAASGGSMYGLPLHTPCDETTPVNPLSPYALSKYTGEQYVKLWERLYGLPATVLRYGNVYGPRQDPHGEAGVCAIFTSRLLAGEPVKIFGDGTQIRDYVSVSDVARANLLAVGKGIGESVNIGTGLPTTTRQVFETIKSATGYTSEATQAPARNGEVQEIVLDVHKAEQVLGWKPAISFSDGIAKTVAWYRSQIHG